MLEHAKIADASSQGATAFLATSSSALLMQLLADPLEQSDQHCEPGSYRTSELFEKEVNIVEAHTKAIEKNNG
jgi:hypothetical protein